MREIEWFGGPHDGARIRLQGDHYLVPVPSNPTADPSQEMTARVLRIPVRRNFLGKLVLDWTGRTEEAA